MTTYNFYEMSQGEGHKMYTLWFNAFRNDGTFLRRSYRKNLSIDREKALTEAQRYADRLGVRLEDEAADDLRNIAYGPDVIRFGRYQDTKVCNLPDSYIVWSLKQGWIGEELRQFLLDEAVKRGLYKEFEGQLLAVSLIDWIQKDRAGHDFHFESGKRLTLDLTITKIKSYETPGFGLNFIITFVTSDNKKVIYKGGKDFSHRNDLGDYIRAEVGDTFKVTGTIEHKEYRGQKQTYIKRPKEIKI